MPDIPPGAFDSETKSRCGALARRARSSLFSSSADGCSKRAAFLLLLSSKEGAPSLAPSSPPSNSDALPTATSSAQCRLSLAVDKNGIGASHAQLEEDGRCERKRSGFALGAAFFFVFRCRSPKEKKLTFSSLFFNIKTGIEIDSDDGSPCSPRPARQLSTPSNREARGGNATAIADRLKPSFLKGKRAYLVATSCYLPPKEDFVHKTFMINAIRKSVSF